MKLNENLKIIGTNVILVPYESKHVLKYHRWMQDDELRELTASEPLTLEEEYNMQKSWREDEDKCTFLILDRERFEQAGDEVEALIGDTNIFLGHQSGGDGDQLVGEIEIMIAERPARRKHCGWEATLLMLLFGAKRLKLQEFRAITKDTNRPAMKMFERMKFHEISRASVFQEVTFARPVDDEWLAWMVRELPTCSIVPYHEL